MFDFAKKMIRPIMMVAIGLASAGLPSALGAETYDLAFNAAKFSAKSADLDGKKVEYRAYEGIVYVKNPVDLQYQTMNVYVPAAYYEAKTINGYKIDTAPIFLPNSIGGYMPGAASKPGDGMDKMHNTIIKALAQGFVVATPGARGRTLKAADGTYTGKAPAAIVDLKAAVRYLRLNDRVMPGSAERIVSNGTSAGGAMSALLGATGNNADYEPYLKALGAADARDDIWAVSAYCPITNLDNADTAYEWLLGDLKETNDPGMMQLPANATGTPPAGTPTAGGDNAASGQTGQTGLWGAPVTKSAPLSDAQIALSGQYKAAFPAYVNGLGLKKSDGTKLTLDANGNGTFRDFVKSYLVASAQTALKNGTDLSKLTWVGVKNGSVVDIDWNGYVQYCTRKKGVPSFDALDNSSGENNEFGTATVGNQHFTAFAQTHNTAAGATLADSSLIKMMNPMNYIGTAGTTTSPNWRIRHGTKDSDTAIAIPTILATKLENTGFKVDFATPWDVPHSGDYDLDELFAWVKQISK